MAPSMLRSLFPALVASIAVVAPHPAEARFALAIGDLVFADGQTFTYEEYEEYKKTHPADGSVPTAAAVQRPAPAANPYPTQPDYVPAPQYQAPPTATVVNGQPVVTVAPPPVAAPLPIQGAPIGVAAAQPYPNYAATPGASPLRAASCRTQRGYPEFHGDGERFDCGPAGRLSRPEMLAQGWKIDFVEKLPTEQAGLNAYKIVLSR